MSSKIILARDPEKGESGAYKAFMSGLEALYNIRSAHEENIRWVAPQQEVDYAMPQRLASSFGPRMPTIAVKVFATDANSTNVAGSTYFAPLLHKTVARWNDLPPQDSLRSFPINGCRNVPKDNLFQQPDKSPAALFGENGDEIHFRSTIPLETIVQHELVVDRHENANPYVIDAVAFVPIATANQYATEIVPHIVFPIGSHDHYHVKTIADGKVSMLLTRTYEDNRFETVGRSSVDIEKVIGTKDSSLEMKRWGVSYVPSLTDFEQQTYDRSQGRLILLAEPIEARELKKNLGYDLDPRDLNIDELRRPSNGNRQYFTAIGGELGETRLTSGSTTGYGAVTKGAETAPAGDQTPLIYSVTVIGFRPDMAVGMNEKMMQQLAKNVFYN